MRHWKPKEFKRKNTKNEEPRTHTHTNDLIVICHIAYFNSIIFKNQDVSIWSSWCVFWARIIGFNNNGLESWHRKQRGRERKQIRAIRIHYSENVIQLRTSQPQSKSTQSKLKQRKKHQTKRQIKQISFEKENMRNIQKIGWYHLARWHFFLLILLLLVFFF